MLLVIPQAQYRARKAAAEGAIAKLTAEARTPERRAASIIAAGEGVVRIAELWPDMTKDQRKDIATMLLEPRGLVIQLLGHGTALKRTRWEAAAGIPRKPTCELVEIRLRPAFRELLQATSDVSHEPVVI